MSTPTLSYGELEYTVRGHHVPKPVFQILNLRMNNKNKLRFCLSDGMHFYGFFGLNKQLNYLYYKRFLTVGTVIRLDDYVRFDFKNGRNIDRFVDINKLSIISLSTPRIGAPAEYKRKN